MSRGKDRKPHIGIYGRRNNGKSSLINCLSEQETAIVSDVAGTTTDPVKKSMEIFGIGPVILVDTAGIDDSGDLGKQRIKKTIQTISQIDLAVLLIINNEYNGFEKDLIHRFEKKNIPYILIHNKSDINPLRSDFAEKIRSEISQEIIEFSCTKPSSLTTIVSLMKDRIPKSAYIYQSLIGDLIQADDVVLLVTPIDSEAPEGRMILPQVQLLRDVLDNDAVCITLKESELASYIKIMQPKPALVITDSQVFDKVDKSVPEDILMSSFSIVLARQKGNFEYYIQGTPKLGELKKGDKVLLLESCTHQVTCDDIGRIKIPRWLNEYAGDKLEYTVVSGLDELPGDITDYAIVIQCGGCMITKKQIQNRLQTAIDAGVPVTNYGMAIAFVHGIFSQAVLPVVKAKT